MIVPHSAILLLQPDNIVSMPFDLVNSALRAGRAPYRCGHYSRTSSLSRELGPAGYCLARGKHYFSAGSVALRCKSASFPGKITVQCRSLCYCQPTPNDTSSVLHRRSLHIARWLLQQDRVYNYKSYRGLHLVTVIMQHTYNGRHHSS